MKAFKYFLTSMLAALTFGVAAADKLARAGYSGEEEAVKLQDWYIRRVREAEGGAGMGAG